MITKYHGSSEFKVHIGYASFMKPFLEPNIHSREFILLNSYVRDHASLRGRIRKIRVNDCTSMTLLVTNYYGSFYRSISMKYRQGSVIKLAQGIWKCQWMKGTHREGKSKNSSAENSIYVSVRITLNRPDITRRTLRFEYSVTWRSKLSNVK